VSKIDVDGSDSVGGVAVNERVAKTLAIVALVAVGAAALVAWNSPATGYESSIYRSTPVLVWIGIGTAFACGTAIAVFTAYGGESVSSRWILGLICIFLATALVLSLHVVRGYAFWQANGDPASHVGVIRALVEAGTLEGTNKYPVLHVLAAQVHFVTGLEIEYIGKVLPLVFALVGKVFVYLWAVALFRSGRAVVMMTLAGSMLVGGWYLNLTPNHMGNLLFPMFLYAASSTVGPERRTGLFPLLLLFIVLLPVLHPVPAFAFLFVMATLWLPRWGLQMVGWIRQLPRPWPLVNWSITSLLAVWTVAWISNFRDWEGLWRSLLEASGGAIARNLDMARLASGLGYNVTAYFLRNYFDLLFFGLAALFAVPLVLRAVRSSANEDRLLGMYGPLATVSFLFLLTYFVDFSGLARTTTYLVLFAVPFSGFLLATVFPVRVTSRRWIAAAAAVTLVGFSFMGVMRVYPSQYIQEYNPHLTYSESDGMDWFFQRARNGVLSGLTVAPGRMTAYLYSTTYERDVRYYPVSLTGDAMVPHHFGYDQFSRVGCSYAEGAYLVLTAVDRSLYTEVWPELAHIRFTVSDFASLEGDHSLDKLYVNGGLDVWCVRPVECASALSVYSESV
jgi:hypothetical protein